MEKQEPVDERRGYLLLWIGVLLAPIVWLVQFQLRYSLVEWVCSRQNRFALTLISVVFFLFMAAGAFLSWRNWVGEGKGSPTDKESGPHQRNLFLAVLGMSMSGLFFLVLLAQTIAAFMVNPCWH